MQLKEAHATAMNAHYAMKKYQLAVKTLAITKVLYWFNT